MAWPFGGERIVNVGGVKSMFRESDALRLFPALSTAVAVTCWPAPSLGITSAAGQVATPEAESEQVNVTVTGALFQPLEFGAGEAAAVICGAVLSMLTLVLTVAILPATSTATAPIVWFRPSVVTVFAWGQ